MRIVQSILALTLVGQFASGRRGYDGLRPPTKALPRRALRHTPQTTIKLMPSVEVTSDETQVYPGSTVPPRTRSRYRLFRKRPGTGELRGNASEETPEGDEASTTSPRTVSAANSTDTASDETQEEEEEVTTIAHRTVATINNSGSFGTSLVMIIVAIAGVCLLLLPIILQKMKIKADNGYTPSSHERSRSGTMGNEGNFI